MWQPMQVGRLGQRADALRALCAGNQQHERTALFPWML